MTGTLLASPQIRAIDANGLAMAGALLQAYLTGTTTPTPVYATSALATPLSNPVVADSGGLFAAIFLDPAVTYRLQLKTAGGSLVTDADPVGGPVQIAAGAITNTQLAAGVAVANLGYTPLNKAGDTATNLLLANSVLASTSAGYLGLPFNAQPNAYTLALGDAGKLIWHNSATAHAYTIPPVASVAFPIGTVVAIRNFGAGVVTLTRGTGVAIRLAGSATNQDVAVAQYGFGTLIMEVGDVWVASGTGFS
ncbi:MAG: hypothetical protein H0X27_07775 [Caulobacteraceae bacterium]|nr:hypothetical protein [Caulobacteraceae bacterium]